METARFKIKLGEHEFDAEGPAEVLKPQLDAFMAAIAAMKPSNIVSPNPIGDNIVSPNPANYEAPPAGAITTTTLERVFRSGPTLSLAAIPNSDNPGRDALLLLLYGYSRLKGEPTVTGTSLSKSARVSGTPVDRLDRVMTTMEEFVMGAGFRKARRYQLNNRGITRAEEIIKTILQ